MEYTLEHCASVWENFVKVGPVVFVLLYQESNYSAIYWQFLEGKTIIAAHPLESSSIFYRKYSGVFCVCFCWYRGFCHRTGSDLLLFLFISTLIPSCSVERCNKVPRVRVFQVSLFISFEFWLCCVMDSFILRNLMLTSFRIFCWYRGFCHRTGSDLLLFLFISTLIPSCSVERCNKVPRVRVFQVSLFISFEFWLCCVMDSFILRNLMLTSFRIFCWYRGFCHRTGQISYFFSFK